MFGYTAEEAIGRVRTVYYEAARGVLVNVVSTLEERSHRKVRAHYIGYPAKIASIINIGSQRDPIVTRAQR